MAFRGQTEVKADHLDSYDTVIAGNSNETIEDSIETKSDRGRYGDSKLSLMQMMYIVTVSFSQNCKIISVR